MHARWCQPLSVNPSIGVSVETMIECGAKEYELITSGGEWWRLIRCAVRVLLTTA
jgi:hypothetical protein